MVFWSKIKYKLKLWEKKNSKKFSKRGETFKKSFGTHYKCYDGYCYQKYQFYMSEYQQKIYFLFMEGIYHYLSYHS